MENNRGTGIDKITNKINCYKRQIEHKLDNVTFYLFIN